MIHLLNKNNEEGQTKEDMLENNSSEIGAHYIEKELIDETEPNDEFHPETIDEVMSKSDLDKGLNEMESQEKIDKQFAAESKMKNSDKREHEFKKEEEEEEKTGESSNDIGSQGIENDTKSEQDEENYTRNYKDNRCYQNDDDEMYFYNGSNQITTVVEVHAENDLSANDNDSELDIADDCLIPVDDGVELELVVNNKIQLEIDINSEMCIDQKEFDVEQYGKVKDTTGNNVKSVIDECEDEDFNKNNSNLHTLEKINDRNNIEQNHKVTDEIINRSSKTNELLHNETTQILINQIKNYNARSSDDVEYSYEAIEKKIDNASKHIMNVKSITVNDTRRSTEVKISDKVIKNKEKMENTMPNNHHLILTRPNNRIDVHSKLQNYNRPLKSGTLLNIIRGRNTPRQELPLLNKPLTNKKVKSDIKPNRKSEDKIPQIKTEASFDMRLLIKAINDLDTTKPKSTGCTRSNSGRSSETSKKSTNTRKSNSSTNSNVSKRPNMSFTKDEAKKIDLENQILLRKIMNQKPQPPPPGVSHQIRRKPTAYINRQKLQDRISHDNTVSVLFKASCPEELEEA